MSIIVTLDSLEWNSSEKKGPSQWFSPHLLSFLMRLPSALFSVLFGEFPDVTDYDNWDHHENSQRDDDDDVNDYWGEFKRRSNDSREEKQERGRGPSSHLLISSASNRKVFIYSQVTHPPLL